MTIHRLSIALALCALCLPLRVLAVEPAELVRSAVELACQVGSSSDVEALAGRLPGVMPGQFTNEGVMLTSGRRRRISLPQGQLTIDWIAPKGFLYQIRARFDGDGGTRPQIYAIANVRCELLAARRLRYDDVGGVEWLEHLDNNFDTSVKRVPFNPPVPSGDDPGGIAVALVDTGVNYLLPQINDRLARDAAGGLLGYDFWDLDRRPFDVNIEGSVFAPDHHGTKIASVVLSGAPPAKLLPYRYPHSDMHRMRSLVRDAVNSGARIANVALASQKKGEWLPFFEAASANPELLFVVAAGNRSNNIEDYPDYPAAFSLSNMITVTGSTADGRLAEGVNWGPSSVDLMVPADIVVSNFDGLPHNATGTSYAAARVTAFAACLLTRHPEWSVAELKQAVLGYATVPLDAGKVRFGFISDAALGGGRGCPKMTADSVHSPSTRSLHLYRG